jgi:hypothetical protein
MTYKVKVAVCSEIHTQHINTMWVTYRIFFKWSQLGAHYFLVYLFQLLYLFRATVYPSSGELTLSMRHWYFSLCMVGCLVCTSSWYICFNFCTCFGELYAHHQENLLYLCDTGIFHSIWFAVWSRQSPIQSEKYECRINTVSSPDDGHIVGRNMYRSWNKYTKQ